MYSTGHNRNTLTLRVKNPLTTCHLLSGLEDEHFISSKADTDSRQGHLLTKKTEYSNKGGKQ